MKNPLLIFVLILISLAKLAAQTNPIPFVLDDAIFGSYATPAIDRHEPVLPSNMALHSFSSKPSATTTTQGTADASISPYTADMSAGGFFGGANISQIRVQGSSDKNIGAVVYAFDTRHRTSVQVSVTVSRTSNGAGINGIALQYRVGTAGSFTALASGSEYLTDETSQTISATLPAAAENKAVVQIRILYFDLLAGGYDGISIGKLFITSDRTAPEVTTGVASNRQPSAASISGEVTTSGTYAVTERGVVYGLYTDPDPTLSSSKAAAGSGAGPFLANLTGLTSATTYKARAYATYQHETVYGEAISFHTLAGSLSQAVTGLSAVGSTNVVALSWDDVPGASGYVVLRREDGQFPTSSGIVQGTSSASWALPAGTTRVIETPNSAYINYSLQPYTHYTYAVIPYSGAGSSSTANYYLSDIATAEAWTDITDPAITGKSPADNADDVDISSNFTLTFSEAIQKGSGDILIRKVAEGSPVVQTISVGSASVSVSGSSLTINPPTDLPYNTYLYITVPPSAVEDVAGNTFAGVNYANEWNFLTEAAPDPNPPVVIGLTPLDNAEDVFAGTTLYVSFNEIVHKGTGNILIKRLSDKATIQTIDVASAAVTVTGSNLAINPPADLPAATELYVNVPAGAVVDGAGNSFAGITGISAWAFTTDDDAVPAVVNQSPADDQGDVSVSANLVVTFNEAIQKVSGDINIYRASDDHLLQSLHTSSANISVSGSTLTINPPTDLPAETELYVTISATAITDTEGNFFPGIVGVGTWSFTTGIANTLPAVVSGSAFNRTTTTASVSAEVTSEGDSPVTERGVVYSTAPNPTVETSGKAMGGSGPGAFTANMTGLSVNTFYFARAYATSAAGTSYGSSVTFRTLAAAPLGAVTGFTANATSNTAIQLTWSLVSGASGYIILRREDGAFPDATGVEQGEYHGNWSLPAGTSLVTTANSSTSSYHNTGLIANTQYTYAIIPFNSGGNSDASNYYVTALATASDRTDVNPPVTSSLSPADNSANVPVASNLLITFSEAVSKGTGNILVKKSADNTVLESIDVTGSNVVVAGSTATIDPASDFPTSASIYIEVPNTAFSDISGNVYSGISGSNGWNFSTEAGPDLTPPALSSVFPADNSENIAPDTELVLTFNESIAIGNGNILIKKVSDDTELMSVDVQSAEVTVVSESLLINPSTDLPEGTEVYVLVPATAVTDATGNAFAGLDVSTSWTFTIAGAPDDTPPSILSFSPDDDASGVPVSANLAITFDEAVYIPGVLQVEMIRIRAADHQTFEQFNLPSARVTGYGTNTITIDPTLDFEDGTSYYVQAFSAFGDQAGNLYAGDLNAAEDTWNFTTQSAPDNTAPGLLSTFPYDNSDNMAPNANLILTFSENMAAGSGNLLIRKASDDSEILSIDVTGTEVSISGTTVTVDPASDLPEQTELYIVIPSGAFTDLAGNAYAGISDNTSWSFTTVATDQTAPMIVSVSPADDATDVGVSANLVITFDEPVQKSSEEFKAIVLRRYDTYGNVQIVQVSSSNVTVNGAEVTIDFPSNFGYNTHYNIEISFGAFVDMSGNEFSGINMMNRDTWDFWTEPAPDLTAPVLSYVAPADDSEDVELDANLIMTFNENVQKGSGSVSIRKASDDSEVMSINVESAEVNVSGTTVTVNPASDLPEQTELYIVIPSGAFTDLAGNAYAGISDNTSWSFTTVATDQTAPVIVSVSPADNATDVGVSANFVITFDEPVQKSSEEFKAIVLRRYDTYGNVQIVQVSSSNVTVNGAEVTIDFPSNFGYNTHYNIEISFGAFVDMSGNEFSGINMMDRDVWDFWTVPAPDVVAPVLSSVSPADDSEDVELDANLVMTFNENIQKGSGSVSIRKAADDSEVMNINVESAEMNVSGTTVTIDPASDLPQLTELYVNIPEGVFTDLAGNAYAGISDKTSWSFTTLATDQTPPQIVSVSPADDATGVDIFTNFVISFNEPVQKTSEELKSVILRLYDNYYNSQSVKIISSNVTVDGSEVTVDFPSDLSYNKHWFIEISGGAFLDMSGNQFGGISMTDRDTWDFWTQAAPDVAAPWVSSFYPSDNSTGVALDANLTLTFNESMAVGTGNILIGKVSDDSEVMSIDVEGVEVSVSGTTVTINPATDLPEMAELYVNIPAGAFTDLAGNTYAGISDKGSWSFTTLSNDVTAPVVLSTVPATFATGVDATANLVLQFSENIQRGTGSITIRKLNNELVESFAVATSDRLTYSGSQLVIDPTDDLPFNTQFYVLMSFGAAKDLAGNSATAWVNWTDLTFTTQPDPADAAPELLSLSPENGAVGVSRTPVFSLELSESVAASTPNEKVILYRYDTDEPLYNLGNNVSYDGHVVTLNYPYTLSYGTKYYVLVEHNAFKDAAGHYLPAITSKDEWAFTTEAEPDDAAPIISSLSPANFSSDVPHTSELVLVFDEAVQKGAGSIELRRYADNTVLAQKDVSSADVSISGSTLTISSILPDINEAVYVYMASGVITDLSGNSFELTNKDTWRFTLLSSDQAAPTVTQFFPADDAADVVTTVGTLSLTFSEPVQKGSGTLRLRYVSNLDVVHEFEVESSDVTVAGNTAYLNDVPTLEPGVQYYVQNMSGGAFKDMANNDLAGWNNQTTWNFTTSENPDQTAPQQIALSPAHQATDVDVSTALMIQFDESIQKGTGNILVKRVSDNLLIESIDVESASVVVSGNSLNVTLTAVLPGGTELYVTVPSSAVADAAGNAFAGIAGTTAWTFSTARLTQEISFPPIANKVYGESFTPIATTTSGLSLTFEVVSGPAVIVGSLVELTGAGTVTLRATQAGDSHYHAAEPVEQSFAVAKATQVISFGTLPEKTYGDAAFLLSATGGASGQAVTFASSNTAVATISGSTVTITGAGETTITASQLGNINYEAAEPVSQVLSINMASQSISFPELEAKTYGDAAFNLSATGGASGEALSFTSSNAAVATVSGNTITIVGAGETTITASQAGNDNYLAAIPVERVLVVSKADQTISFGPIADTELSVQTVALAATASSGLAINFIADGPAELDGTVLTLTGAGLVTVTATQPGDGNFNAATPVSQTFTVADDSVQPDDRKEQQITFSLPFESVYEDEGPIRLRASSSSGLDIVYSVVEGSATIAGETLTLEGPGKVVIAANQPGDDRYKPAAEKTATLVVKALMSISGEVTGADGAQVEGEVQLFTVAGALAATVPLTAGAYTLDGLKAGSFYLKFLPEKSLASSWFATYYVSATQWTDATQLSLSEASLSDISWTAIAKSAGSSTAGNGTIRGRVVADATAGKGAWIVMGRTYEGGEALGGITVYLLKSSDGSIFAEAITDATGAFEMAGLPSGSYKLHVDVPGIAMDPASSEIDLDENVPLELTAVVGEDGITTEISVIKGVEDELRISVTVYPNPTTDEVTLELPEGTTPGQRLVSLHDLQGRQQLRETFSTPRHSLSLQQLPAGVYLLLVQDEEATALSAIRIVKK